MQLYPSIRDIGLTKPKMSLAWPGRVALYLNRVIFFALLALIPLTAIPYGTVEPNWEAIFECYLFTLGVLWIIEGLLSNTWRVERLGLIAPPLVLVGFAFFQTMPLGSMGTISADPFETQRFIYKILALILAGELLLRYTSSPRRLSILVHVIIALGVANALFGIIRQTMQGNSSYFILAGLKPDVGYGQFINRNHFAFLMEMTLGLLLGFVIGGGVRRDRRLTYLTLALPMWVALVLSNSRGGIFSLLCQMIFIVLLFTGMQRRLKVVEPHQGMPGTLQRIGGSFVRKAVLIIGLLIAGSFSVLWIGGDPLMDRLETTPGEIGPTTTGARLNVIGRKEIWQATWQLIKDNPLVGVGMGGYGATIAKYHNAAGDVVPQQAHNDYLELLASGGPIGIIIAAWFVTVLIRSSRSRFRSSDTFRRAACFGAIVGLFTIAVHSFVDFGLHITINAFVFTTLVVIATAGNCVKNQVVC